MLVHLPECIIALELTVHVQFTQQQRKKPLFINVFTQREDLPSPSSSVVAGFNSVLATSF